MAKTASTPGRRFMKLASMTASIATKTVSNSIKNFNADEEQKNASRSQLFQDIGLQIADTLGEMKGAVMKVGQIASQYKDVFPPEVARAIAKLQRQAPAMPFAEIKAQVEKELGKPLHQILKALMNNLLPQHRLVKCIKPCYRMVSRWWLKCNIRVSMKPAKVILNKCAWHCVLWAY